ncbi:MAG: reverse transcriptase-like protein, partial [Terracidiphilus sp.]
MILAKCELHYYVGHEINYEIFSQKTRKTFGIESDEYNAGSMAINFDLDETSQILNLLNETSKFESQRERTTTLNEMRTVNASFDGACEPWNPGGHMGLGWVIDGIEHHEYIESGPGNTNNVAEYRALIRLLEAMISEKTPGNLIIIGDSKLVVNQVAGDWICNGHRVDLRREVGCLIDRLKETGCTRNRFSRLHAARCSGLSGAAPGQVQPPTFHWSPP